MNPNRNEFWGVVREENKCNSAFIPWDLYRVGAQAKMAGCMLSSGHTLSLRDALGGFPSSVCRQTQYSHHLPHSLSNSYTHIQIQSAVPMQANHPGLDHLSWTLPGEN